MKFYNVKSKDSHFQQLVHDKQQLVMIQQDNDLQADHQESFNNIITLF